MLKQHLYKTLLKKLHIALPARSKNGEVDFQFVFSSSDHRAEQFPVFQVRLRIPKLYLKKTCIKPIKTRTKPIKTGTKPINTYIKSVNIYKTYKKKFESQNYIKPIKTYIKPTRTCTKPVRNLYKTCKQLYIYIYIYKTYICCFKHLYKPI